MSLTTDAFERIRNAIISGRLDFGEPLSETQIANALGMSKAPVRAALIELKDKGLVNIVPQAGTYVFSPSAEDVRTLSHFRLLLEREAMHEAMKLRPAVLLARLDEAVATMKRAVSAKNWEMYTAADTAYHLAILQESGNPHLLKAYQLADGAHEAMRVRLQKGAGIRDRSFAEHVSMAKLLRIGKITDALKILRAHILHINESLHTLPATPDKVSRKEYSSLRNYVEIFSRSQSGNGQGGGEETLRPMVSAKSRDSQSPARAKH